MNENEAITIFIEPEWLNGNTCLFNINNPVSKAEAKVQLTAMRKKFVEKLRSEGFNITFNKEDIDEDTICLIMDDTSLCSIDVSLEEYKKLFNEKIFTSAGESFHYPFSLSLPDYFANPFFPAVLKNELTNGGHDKFLIETPEQLVKIKEFYDKYSSNPKYKDAFASTICQQYLETPGEYATYLRVLVAGSGDVLGASLKYSARSTDNNDLTGIFEREFLNPNSEYYIGAKKMFNYYSGGGEITFSQPRYSYEKAEILEEHGFDLENLSLPNQVLDVCQNIMDHCNRELGVLCGIDFMLNKADGNWYYLENQAFPAIEEWAWERNIKVPKGTTIKGFLEYLELDLQARYEALSLLVEKRKQQDQGQKRVLSLKDSK